MRKVLSVLALLLGFIYSTQAAYLKDIPRSVVQPNGDTLHCFATGDEFYNYLHDAEGYTIVQDVNTGYYVYAVRSGEEILPSHHIAGRANPVALGLERRVTISGEAWKARAESRLANVPQLTRTRFQNRNRGHINNLVVFIRFSGDNNLTTPYSSVVNMFNDSTTASTNSMYNYFKAASYNTLSITSSFYPAASGNTILSYQDNYTRDYYMPYSATNTIGYSSETERTSREFLLLKNAVNHVSSSIPSSLNIDYDNDGFVDNVCFVIKGDVGDWSDLLWPHRWALYGEDAYINGKQVWDFNFQLEGSPTYFNNSTLCHEMFHTLGAPDLYHYDTDFRHLRSVGSWDLMESNTTPPQHSGAYMKLKYGNWVSSIPEITLPGTYSLKPIGSATNENIAYAIPTDDPDQYIILEYRNTTCHFESGLPGTGVLIYRVDMSLNGNADYDGVTVLDEVYLFRPGGSQTDNGQIYDANFSQLENRTSFDNTTSPYPFLNWGVPCDIAISNITVHGDSATFYYSGVYSQHTITSSAGYGGTISPLGASLVTPGDSLQFTITANAGFIIDDVVVNNNSIGAISSYTFYNISANHTIEAFFVSETSPEIIVSEDTLRFNTPVGTTSATQTLNLVYTSARDTVTFSIPQNAPFEISENGLFWGRQLTFPNTNPISLHVRYNPATIGADTINMSAYMTGIDTTIEIVLIGESTNRTFTLTVTQAANGTITPSGSQTVNWDDQATFHFTPNSGYYTRNIVINGQNYPGDTTYTIQNIRSDYTVSAIFQRIPNAMIFVDTSTIAFETTINTANPTAILFIVGVDIENPITCQTTGKFYMLDGNSTATRTLQINPIGGSITVQYIPTVIGDDEGELIISSDEVASPISIRLTGTCHPVRYQVSALYGAGGEVVPGGTILVTKNDDITFNIIPDDGYELTYLLIDEELQEEFSDDYYTFANVLRNHTLFAYFSLKSNVDDYIQTKLSIYPNPVQNQLRIRFDEMSVPAYNYVIYDMQGRLIQTVVQTTSDAIDVPNLSRGIYLLQITKGDSVWMEKFVKE